MWPAHVSFPIHHDMTDTRGDGSSLTLLLFQLSTIGDGAVVQYCSPTINVAAETEEMGSVLLQKCLKTTANRGVKEKVKQQDKYNAF